MGLYTLPLKFNIGEKKVLQKSQVRVRSPSIVFIRAHPVVDEPRMEKEVHSAITNGFQVTILAWDRKGANNKFEHSSERTIYRFRLHAPYGKFFLVVYYPFFWLWVLSKLLVTSPRLVHACDPDTIFPALLYRGLRAGETKVIFDMFDSIAMTLLDVSKLMSEMVSCLERFAGARSDAVISVSEYERTFLFRGAKLRRNEIIGNFPDERFVIPDSLPLNRNKKTFRLVFAGSVGQYRGVLEVAESIKDLDNVELIVAGRVADNSILDTIMRLPNVKYCGPLAYAKSLSLQASADVLPVLYDLDSPWFHMESPGLSPNKLYEAMMLGIPIITNLNRPLLTVDCGIIIKYNDITAIRKAIIYLKDNPEARQRLGQNGKLAYEQKYNWKSLEKKLVALYNELIESTGENDNE